MRLCALLLLAGSALPMLNACAGEPVQGPDLSGRPEARPGEDLSSDSSSGRDPRQGGMHPLFISPAGQPFHGVADGPPPVALWFAQADADHDGRLTRTELTTDFERFFRQLDANRDGVIDGFEAQAYERGIAPELLPQVGRLRAGEGQDDRLFKAGGRGGGVGGGRAGRGGRGSRGSGKSDGVQRQGGAQPAGTYQLFPDFEPVTAADADLDGKVTLDEWRARSTAVFRQLDTAGAGYMTLSTLPKTPQQLAIERRDTVEKRRP